MRRVWQLLQEKSHGHSADRPEPIAVHAACSCRQLQWLPSLPGIWASDSSRSASVCWSRSHFGGMPRGCLASGPGRAAGYSQAALRWPPPPVPSRPAFSRQFDAIAAGRSAGGEARSGGVAICHDRAPRVVTAATARARKTPLGLAGRGEGSCARGAKQGAGAVGGGVIKCQHMRARRRQRPQCRKPKFYL